MGMPAKFAEYANIGKGLMKEISRPLIENSQGVAFTGIKQKNHSLTREMMKCQV